MNGHAAVAIRSTPLEGIEAQGTTQFHRPGESLQDAGLGSMALAMLDHVDYPMLVVDIGLNLLWQNLAGRSFVGRQGGGLSSVDGRLGTAHPGGLEPLRSAVERVALRQRHELETVHDLAGSPEPWAMVPLADTRSGRMAWAPLRDDAQALPSLVLMMAQRVDACDGLAVAAYARSRQLTPAETRVLQSISMDRTTEEVAEELGIGMNTIRSHMSNIRVKTGLASIRHMLTFLSRLPPLTRRLR